MLYEAAIVFAALFALDFVWISYTKAVTQHAPMGAAFWAVLILLFNGVSQIGYVNEPWLLVPAAAGAFTGTYAAMWWENKRKQPPGSKPAAV